MVVERDEDCDPRDARLAAGAAVFEPDDDVEPFVLAAVPAAFFLVPALVVLAVLLVTFFAAAFFVAVPPEAGAAPFACWAALRVARARGVGRDGSAVSCDVAGSAPTKDS